VLRISGSYLPGFGSITIAVLLLGGIQLIAIGIIGEYVGRIYAEVKGRPLYLVRSRLNIADTEAPAPPLPPVTAERGRPGESAPVTAETPLTAETVPSRDD
jgi:polyisoprenyl-phosphate glycosyltransferase